MRNHFLRAKGQPQADNSWDLDFASFAGSPTNRKWLGGQEVVLNGIAFKTDGTKMYSIGENSDNVNQYDLTTAWDISTASYTQNFSVSSQDTSPQEVRFKTDGSKMYVLGKANGRVYEYNLSTSWDISTASYSQYYSIESRDNSAYGLDFAPDGTKFWILGNENDRVNQFTLSTAWDISTASWSTYKSTYGTDRDARACFIRPDNGTSFFYVGSYSDKVWQWTLSTAYSISSISLGQSVDVSDVDFVPTGLFFDTNGTKMFVTGNTSDYVFSFDLSTAWSINTATFSQPTSEVFSVASQDTFPGGIEFKPDGTKMYVVGGSGDDVNEYDLSTAWDITTASYNQRDYVGSQEGRPKGLYFKPDGTKYYICGDSGDEVNQYNLSTAWDISTASYSTRISVRTQDSRPRGVAFKPDGTKMYVVGGSTDTIYEYSLSVAWNVGYASYSQSFALGSIDLNPFDVKFKDDGTIMYVSSLQGHVSELALSTAWDVTTASLNSKFIAKDLVREPCGIAFKPDGSKFFITDQQFDRVVAFTIS